MGVSKGSKINLCKRDMSTQIVYYRRKCISCLNRVIIAVILPSSDTQATCPHCRAVVRIWP